jgi:hypothetical protein
LDVFEEFANLLGRKHRRLVSDEHWVPCVGSRGQRGVTKLFTPPRAGGKYLQPERAGWRGDAGSVDGDAWAAYSD